MIPHTSIERYAEKRGLDVDAFERIIRKMDNVYMEDYRKTSERNKKNG